MVNQMLTDMKIPDTHDQIPNLQDEGDSTPARGSDTNEDADKNNELRKQQALEAESSSPKRQKS